MWRIRWMHLETQLMQFCHCALFRAFFVLKTISITIKQTKGILYIYYSCVIVAADGFYFFKIVKENYHKLIASWLLRLPTLWCRLTCAIYFEDYWLDSSIIRWSHVSPIITNRHKIPFFLQSSICCCVVDRLVSLSPFCTESRPFINDMSKMFPECQLPR